MIDQKPFCARVARYTPEAANKNVFDLQIEDHLFRCGDYAAYPSLNAAMKTGREVAEML